MLLAVGTAYLLLAPDREPLLGTMLLLAAVPLGVAISGLTERHLVGPAERFMNLVTGFGNKGQDAEFDDQGVPVVSLRRLGAKFYNPVAVGMAAMRAYDKWDQSGDPLALEGFRNCCDSLVEHLLPREARGMVFGVWEYDYPFTYGLEPPWISALAQGVGAQILSRCYRVTGDERYRKAARQALDALFVPVEDGGVTYQDTDDHWWYEEFVGAGVRPSRALNGMIYVLLGVQEYGENTGDPDAARLLDKGVAGLRKDLATYDTGVWTYYDAVGTLATASYHAVHVDLSRQVFELTGDGAFRDAWQRWAGYRSHFFRRAFLWKKPSWHDWVVLSFNIGGVWVVLRLLLFAWP